MLSELDEILADTGPLIRFAQRDLQAELAGHMASSLRVCQDVHNELHFQAKGENPKLQTFSWLNPKFPPDEPIRALGQVAKNIDRIQERKARQEQQASGAMKKSDWRNRGEIATVLIAADRGSAVLVDDGFGRDLANARHLRVAGTDDLAAEMVAVSVLSVEHGRALAKSARGTDETAFAALVRHVCIELGVIHPLTCSRA